MEQRLVQARVSLWSQDQRFIETRILMIPIGSVIAIRTHLQREFRLSPNFLLLVPPSPNLRWETGTLLPLNCFLFVCEHDFATENCIFGRPSGPALAGPITTLPEERDLFFTLLPPDVQRKLAYYAGFSVPLLAAVEFAVVTMDSDLYSDPVVQRFSFHV